MYRVFKLIPVSLISLCLLFAYPVNAEIKTINLNKLSSLFKKAKQATGKMSEKKEIQLGGNVAAVLLGAAPLVDDEELQVYVNNVGMWLALQSERPDLPWRFGVIDSENINAFAAPGGYVFITKGLFLTLNNEAELAGVLGHEMAHVVQQHHLNAIVKNSRAELASDILSLAAEDNTKSLEMLTGFGTQLYSRGLDREDEYEADRVGVVIAARGGYDPFALLNVLTTLDSINANSGQMALFLKTHPPPAERLSLLDRTMDDKLRKFADQAHNEEQFKPMHRRLAHRQAGAQ